MLTSEMEGMFFVKGLVNHPGLVCLTTYPSHSFKKLV